MDVPKASQELQPIRDQFLVRFYHWSMEFSQREFDGNFPILGRIKNSSIRKFVSFARSLNRKETSLLCSALVKRFHSRAVEVLEDFPSTEEAVLFDRCLEARRTHISESRNPQFKAIIRQSSKAALRKSLLRRLGTVLGEPHEIAANREIWEYRLQIRCWTVRTQIDSGGRRSFGYAHSIDARPAVNLRGLISILSWMGISSQTDWFDLSEEDYSEAAECLADVCTCFLDVVPKLLEGLSHNLPEPEVRYWRASVTVKGHRRDGFTILTSDEPEFRKVFRGRSAWDIPTSIIPERLRKIGSHLAVLQDPTFTRENSEDPLALSPTYKHVRVEPDN